MTSTSPPRAYPLAEAIPRPIASGQPTAGGFVAASAVPSCSERHALLLAESRSAGRIAGLGRAHRGEISDRTAAYFESLSASAEHLFDPIAFRVPVTRGLGDSALSLDRKPKLVFAPDGCHARVVCLHSLDKAHYAHTYADIVGTGMKQAFPGPLVWIELFAGPGVLFVKDLDDFKPGSPIEATSIRDPFDQYVFVDMDPRCASALNDRVGYWPGVHVLEGDANSVNVLDRIAAIVPRDALVVLYADPAALDLSFATIKFFADRYKHLDLLLNFPVPGVLRALRAGAEAKAARVLDHPSPATLIGPGSGLPGISLREWFERRLRGLGYDHFASEVIRLCGKNVPLYDLMFASRNAKAKEFFNEAQKRGPGGQYRLPI